MTQRPGYAVTFRLTAASREQRDRLTPKPDRPNADSCLTNSTPPEWRPKATGSRYALVVPARLLQDACLLRFTVLGLKIASNIGVTAPQIDGEEGNEL